MKQSLQLKIGQSLTMTPQLQQAIRLLQLSSLELSAEITQALESNPMLEAEDDTDSTDDELSADDAADDELDSDGLQDPADPEMTGDMEEAWDAELPDDLPVDSSWDDIYLPSTTPSAPAASDDEYRPEDSSEETLQDHLLWQLNLTPMSDSDRAIALAIIDGIDSAGMLLTELEEIVQDTPEDIEIEEVTAVLKRIQQFDPPGIAARNLSECLSLQLTALTDPPPATPLAQVLLQEHMKALSTRDYAGIKRALKLSDEELAEAIELIQTLNPRPGNAVDTSEPEYVVPDVFVRKDGNRWLVELNNDTLPKLRINNGYAGLIKRADNSRDNTFLKDNLQEARWFLKSIASRQETLLKVASQIVEQQRGFLDYGEEAMKPLVLQDIADAIDMHESTVSRVTNRKYMHTPRGIFELKYFFSSHVGTTGGGEVSSTAIRALIKKLTAEENPRKPLSDNKIASLLAEQDIKVARRTVAKYRESMAIPPSNERKRLV
ncbi:MAG: RNA polymerase factor sigma-54 [Pseudomonadaceae bacterium]|nr:RNA polymerase factor sigma-54 [Pseudomonadaceae bacterium]